MSNQSFRSDWATRYGNPSPKIVCVGLNYSDHTAESGFEAPKAPLLFGKYANTLCGDGDTIVLPPGGGHVDAEAELAVVIGSPASRVERRGRPRRGRRLHLRERRQPPRHPVRRRPVVPRQGVRHVLPGRPATSCPSASSTPSDLRIQQRLNGEVLQDSRTSFLIFGVPELVSYISAAVTLEPGDLILTGTPVGVGVFREPKVALQPGDEVEIEIEGIGILHNRVA